MTVQAKEDRNNASSYYENNYEHLSDELKKLDLLIHMGNIDVDFIITGI